MDEQRKTEQSQAPAALVLEILLVLSHTQRPVAYVGQIAELANALLENRDENIQLSPRAVGEILRQELGLVARRRPPGYELALDNNVQQRVHRLASDYSVLQPVADCRWCQEVLVSITPDDHRVPGV
jgi:adenine C2-methylase RlmN of 23S rRNA A2503 and tRNA A37